jgi:hypothetical protein
MSSTLPLEGITQTKYVVISKNRILCLKGWSCLDRLDTKQVRLFIHPTQAKVYLEESNYYVNNYDIIKVKLQITNY